MTNTLKHSSALFFALSLLAAGCKDDDPELAPIDQLPPATQNGAYTFGCLVNGEARVPDNTNDIGAIYQGGVLQMYGEFDIVNGEQGIAINIYSSIQNGRKYDLTGSPMEDVIFDWGEGDDIRCRYQPENTLSGTLTITHFDNEEYIVSGTFEFTTATEGCDTIRVTDGRFDIPYTP